MFVGGGFNINIIKIDFVMLTKINEDQVIPSDTFLKTRKTSE